MAGRIVLGKKAWDRGGSPEEIGTKAARTSPEWISGLHLRRRGAQGGVAPPATGYCRRRSGDRLQNAEIAFQPPWYKFEMPCPLVRPSQTHLGRSARAQVDRGPWGFGEGVVGSDHPGNRVPAPLVQI